MISSTLHRDDFSARGLASGTDATQLPFDIDGRHILLIDDVLYTGRTIRAVLNELFDFGRPASVTLAVLVDRGGRQLPIEAAFSAAKLVLPANQRLRCLLRGAFGQEAQRQARTIKRPHEVGGFHAATLALSLIHI